MNVITIERKILEKNDEIARANRELFQQRGIFVINIVSAPGAGKTTILERCMERLRSQLAIGVIEGDVQTDFDARRVARYDVPVVQVVTKGGCHLEAKLVQDAISRMDLSQLRLLVIENVGNLVCPANYDLGEALKVVVLSTTEGADKPLKYPTMFRRASVLLVNKIDLLPYVDCDLDELQENARQINPQLEIFPLSATTGEGVSAWCDWLLERSAGELGRGGDRANGGLAIGEELVMCLAIPGQIASIEEQDPVLRSGRVSFGGIIKLVNLACVPEAQVGDYVLVHAGMAITTVDEDEAARVLDELQQMGELDDVPHDQNTD